MSGDPTHLRLAGVTRLSLSPRRGPPDAYLFDPHRLALPCWALALEEAGIGRPATLVTFDRHYDLVAPAHPADVPPRSAGVRALDEHARWSLDVRNYDHVLAAMEAGLVCDAIVIARARPRGAFAGDVYLDRRGTEHQLLGAPTLARIAEEWGEEVQSSIGFRVRRVLESGRPVLLDVDLDCFTTPSDADPTTLVPWPAPLVRELLLPRGAEPFWDAVLAKAVCLTIAREPHHCGGVIASGRLFETVAGVVFAELLGAELP